MFFLQQTKNVFSANSESELFVQQYTELSVHILDKKFSTLNCLSRIWTNNSDSELDLTFVIFICFEKNKLIIKKI